MGYLDDEANSSVWVILMMRPTAARVRYLDDEANGSVCALSW